MSGGSLLSEADLARQLGVSTTPVHEAVVRLASEGFVEALPRRGVRVVHLTPKDIAEIFELREALEVEVVRLALARASDDDLAALQPFVVAGQHALDRDDYSAFNAADVALHDALAGAGRAIGACNKASTTCASGCSAFGSLPPSNISVSAGRATQGARGAQAARQSRTTAQRRGRRPHPRPHRLVEKRHPRLYGQSPHRLHLRITEYEWSRAVRTRREPRPRPGRSRTGSRVPAAYSRRNGCRPAWSGADPHCESGCVLQGMASTTTPFWKSSAYLVEAAGRPRGATACGPATTGSSGMFPLQAQQEYFASSPDVLSSSAFAAANHQLEPTDGGFRVGRSSGVSRVARMPPIGQ